MKQYLLALVRKDPFLAIALATEAFLKGQIGGVDLGVIILLGVAFVFIGLGIRFSPGMIQGFSAAYTAATSADPNGTIFVGLTDAISFGPGLIIIGFVIAVGVVGFLGVRLFSKRSG